jgi:hypothetical protein
LDHCARKRAGITRSDSGTPRAQAHLAASCEPTPGANHEYEDEREGRQGIAARNAVSSPAETRMAREATSDHAASRQHPPQERTMKTKTNVKGGIVAEKDKRY